MKKNLIIPTKIIFVNNNNNIIENCSINYNNIKFKKRIFLVDTLNFSFWHRVENGVEQIYEVEWDGKKWTGYWALCAVIQRALHEGIPITSAEFMANVELPTLQHIFRFFFTIS